MSIYDKARELANELLLTEEAKKFIEMKYILSGNLESKDKIKRFTELSKYIRGGSLSEEELSEKQDALNSLVEDIKRDPVLRDYTIAENEFSNLINSVMSVFNETLFEDLKDEIEEGSGCSSGGCGGCSGC